MSKKLFQSNPYESPRIEVVLVEVEQGIAGSIKTEDVEFGTEEGWDD